MWQRNRNANDRNSFGVSLSFASSDGQAGAASPQVLANTMIEDDTEVIIMTDQSCDDGGCGFTRPGGVAYRKPHLPYLPSSPLLIQGRDRWLFRRPEGLLTRIFYASHQFHRL